MLGVLKRYINNLLLNKAIRNGLQLGSNCRILGKPNFGSEPYLIKIGDRCTITSGVKFVTHDGGTWVFRDNPQYKHIKKYGKIDIGNNCFIGIDTIIMPGVKIGENTVVGAGSIVTKDIPGNSVAVGSPARVIMTLEEYIERSEKNRTIFPENFNESKKEYLTKYFWG
ncbi:Acetyltransferase (isoleucine patch superfamily) [Bhargavaea ginsengi]|uniref:Acetyltransferase (Isoleucine patch superfamily) n=1 Tax=Bhargavaea ginsengi TaxID=426757 RepID=A0A1H6UJI0_9BACL|nr:acyltransferase [Bhargavaea ginsengi]SEI92473.1 Acetyltransferase (isoleucine patch superfamily) [Bhargavaea ginsengi]